jgi:hypothetical protein
MYAWFAQPSDAQLRRQWGILRPSPLFSCHLSRTPFHRAIERSTPCRWFMNSRGEHKESGHTLTPHTRKGCRPLVLRIRKRLREALTRKFSSLSRVHPMCSMCLTCSANPFVLVMQVALYTSRSCYIEDTTAVKQGIPP